MRSRKSFLPSVLALSWVLAVSAVPLSPLRGQDTTAAPSAPETGTAAPAQEPAALDELLSRVRERFEVRALRQGLLLSPKYAPASVGDIEVSGGTIAIGGRVVTGGEVGSLLGPEDAELVLRLSYADPVRLLQRLGATAAEPDTGSVPAEEPAGEIVSADTAGAGTENVVPGAPEPPVPGGPQQPSEPGEPPGPPEPPEHPLGDQVRMGDDISVPEGQTVLGDVVAIGGDVDVAGHVLGDVVSIGGVLSLHDSAFVNGDAVAVGGRLEKAPGARVLGETTTVGVQFPFVGGQQFAWEWSPLDAVGGFLITLLWIALLLVLGAVFLLAMRRQVERVETNLRSSSLKAGIVGFLAQMLFLPVYVIGLVLLIITIIGIPIAVLWAVGFFVLGFVAALFGFTAVAHATGVTVSERLGRPLQSPYVALLVGLIVLFAPMLIHNVFHLGPGLMELFATLFAVLGCLVLYVACTVGFGAAILTRFGTRTTWSGEPPPGLAAPTPPPPPPPAPTPSPPVPAVVEPSPPEPAWRALPDAPAGRLAEPGAPEPPRLASSWEPEPGGPEPGRPEDRNEPPVAG